MQYKIPTKNLVELAPSVACSVAILFSLILEGHLTNALEIKPRYKVETLLNLYTIPKI